MNEDVSIDPPFGYSVYLGMLIEIYDEDRFTLADVGDDEEEHY